MTPRPGDVLRAMADSYAMRSASWASLQAPAMQSRPPSIERTIARETMAACWTATAQCLRDVADVFDTCAPKERCDFRSGEWRCQLDKGHAGSTHPLEIKP